jgi:hypothetical protein
LRESLETAWFTGYSEIRYTCLRMTNPSRIFRLIVKTAVDQTDKVANTGTDREHRLKAADTAI